MRTIVTLRRGFWVLGILVLCGSFVYLKYRETFATQKPADKENVA